jgi:mono/diheme cytochrome c family protein
VDPSTLRDELNLWYLRYHTLIQKALPKTPWGPARLDAVAMIFNRLTGLDIGPPPSYLIADNIKPAVAPVRYPFLWNAPVQDKTQWPGFADNGNDLLGLSRNLGEVFGVFAEFHPRKDPFRLLKVNYLDNNSANFQGLGALEGLVKRLGPPKWPFAIDTALAEQGKAIYARGTAQGGCTDCHGIRPGTTRFFEQKTWATPILDVGTDSREYEILGFTVQTGELEGARIPLITQPLKPVDAAFNVLATSVMGSILQHTVLVAPNGQDALALLNSPQMMDMKGMFKMAQTPGFAYESRVLEGIWATAPYLHNGSVPTLAELLKPAGQRVASFKVGPAYDIVNVGLAAGQTRFNYTLQTTDCSDRNSGNSRCGHEYGTQLPPDEKRALLEYLKTL